MLSAIDAVQIQRQKQVVGQRMEEIHYTNFNHRTTGMATVLSEKNIYSFKEKRYQQKERGKFHNHKKNLIHWEDRAITNVYTSKTEC